MKKVFFFVSDVRRSRGFLKRFLMVSFDLWLCSFFSFAFSSPNADPKVPCRLLVTIDFLGKLPRLHDTMILL